MPRAIIIVLDSVGIGGAPDADAFGDEGANTLGHIAAECARGAGDSTQRTGPLRLPNLEAMGLGLAAELATGVRPAGFDFEGPATAAFAAMTETSTGKDTPSGHWEMAGVPVAFEWGKFPDTVPAFPRELTDAIVREGDVSGILGNCHASGTEIIERLGAEHIQTKRPIVYTSADSVIQIAAHEEFFGLERLYDLCAVVRKLADPLNIGRVIARPFVGMAPGQFERTGNRRDYSVPPPAPTLLDRAEEDGRATFAVGKIADIFAHHGVSDIRKGADGSARNEAIFHATIQAMRDAADGDLVFANFVDFDSEFGHRRDVAGYAACLEQFDGWMPRIAAELRDGDLLAITADHGNDPTWRGTEHTRERVFALIAGPGLPTGDHGVRDTFADLGATVARHLDLSWGEHGRAFF